MLDYRECRIISEHVIYGNIMIDYFFRAGDGVRGVERSRELEDVYQRHIHNSKTNFDGGAVNFFIITKITPVKVYPRPSDSFFNTFLGVASLQTRI